MSEEGRNGEEEGGRESERGKPYFGVKACVRHRVGIHMISLFNLDFLRPAFDFSHAIPHAFSHAIYLLGFYTQRWTVRMNPRNCAVPPGLKRNQSVGACSFRT